MDKLERYRKIVKEIVEYYGNLQSSVGAVETYAICDEKTDNYLVLDVGWLAFGRQHAIPLHLRLKDAKIWIEWDGTGQEVAQQLIDAGVPENDIVAGFRKFTEVKDAELVAA